MRKNERLIGIRPCKQIADITITYEPMEDDQ